MSLIHEKNGAEIFELFRQLKSPIDLSKNQILSILDYMRYIISHYIKDTYKLESTAEQNAYDSISIDESLFTHDGINQIWVVGLINNRTLVIRLEIVKDRSSVTMKKIIQTLVSTGNIIITDAALCYNWLNDIISGYTHHAHNHGHGEFGEGLDSTSHIEQLWHHLKSLIKNIYSSIPSINFALFLREVEWRRNQKKFEKMIFGNLLMKYVVMYFKLLVPIFIIWIIS